MELGVCGYGYTGSGALVSLLKEFDGISFLGGNVFEFTLSYTNDGLEDLEFSLCTNPSKGTRCDTAIYRFKLLVDMYERSYNKFTQGNFREIAYKYLDSLIQVRWQGIRTFEYERSPFALKRFERRLRGLASYILKKHNIEYRTFPLTERYLSVCPESFVEKTKQFVSSILEYNGQYKCLLLDQPFSVGNPLNSMKFFNSPKCIIVDRDPRDLYVMAKHVYGMNAIFIPTDTVDNFIEYYIRIRDKRYWSESDSILFIKFEDLIYKYDETVNKIISFVGPCIGQHFKKKQFFKPDVSIANTNVFNQFPNEKDAIAKIERDLKEWVYPFENKYSTDYSIKLSDFTFSQNVEDKFKNSNF